MPGQRPTDAEHAILQLLQPPFQRKTRSRPRTADPVAACEGGPDVLTERPVGLELGLVEELVRGRLVRKVRVCRLVARDVLRLVARHRQLDVQH